jgi:hypothetical protein
MQAQEKAKVDKAAVDKAFDALATYDWGTDYNKIKAIDDAAVATQGDAAARKALETRLAAVLKTGASRAAKDCVCRTLMLIGTAESVPALAGMLADPDLSHMARYALERIPAPEAAAAMRDALPKVAAPLKVGVIGSLGARRDAGSVPALGMAFDQARKAGPADAAIPCAIAVALGNIGTKEAANALGGMGKEEGHGALGAALAGGLLACAERLLADGHKADAVAVYKSLSGEGQPKQIQLAAKRGLLSAGE